MRYRTTADLLSAVFVVARASVDDFHFDDERLIPAPHELVFSRRSIIALRRARWNLPSVRIESVGIDFPKAALARILDSPTAKVFQHESGDASYLEARPTRAFVEFKIVIRHGGDGIARVR